MQTKTLFLIAGLVWGLLLTGCSKSDEAGKRTTPTTVFDRNATPDPRSNEVRVGDFVVQLERKYKREDIRNSIDLHFMLSAPDRIKVRLTYDRQGDPTTASSIADAAIELAKRLKREDPSLRDLDIGFDRELVRREE